MSKRYKNNHYHYAEKFDPRNRRMRASDIIKAPKKAITLAVLFLLAFGLISTTFAAYVSSDDFASKRGTVLVSARNTLAQREGPDGNVGLAQTGADVPLSSTGWTKDQCYAHLQKGSGSWVDYTMQDDGLIYFSLSSATTITFDLVAENTWYKKYSGDTAPSIGNTTFTARDNDWGGYNDFSISSVPAGLYAIEYVSRGNSNHTLSYKIYKVNTFASGSYIYLDTKVGGSATNLWDSNSAKILAYFFNNADTNVLRVGVNCTDKTNNGHFIRIPTPSSGYYNGVIFLRGKSSSSFTDGSSGFPADSDLWNRTGDYYFDGSHYNYQVATYGTNLTTNATVTTLATAHTHKIYAYEVVRDTVNDSYPTTADRTIKSGETVSCTDTNIPALVANSRANYTFDGWYRGTTSNPNNANTLVSTELTLANDPDADKKNYSGVFYYFAKYTLNEMTVTFDGYGDRLNDSDEVIVAYGKKPTVGDIPATTATGYTFQYWDCNGTHYTNAQVANTAVTANRTYSAKYNINAPTVSITNATSNNINYEANNSTPLSIGGTVSSSANPDDITLSGVYAWDDSHSADQPDGYLSNTTLNTATGAFTATMPGKYYLKYTGTVTNSDTLNGSASSTVAFTVTVLPEVPTFNISLIGKVDDADMTGVDRDHAWMVLLGAHYHFEATVSNSNSNYTYEWSNDGGTNWYDVNSIPSSWTAEYEKATAANSPGITINTNANGSVLTFADNRQLSPTVGTTSFSLKVRATKNGQSRVADVVEKWFFIERLIHSYKLMPMHQTIDPATQSSVLSTQKIFSVATAAQAGLEAIYSTRVNYTGFTTHSMVSVDNLTYTNAQTLNHTSPNQTLTDLTNTLNSFLTHEGVKYLKLEMQKDEIEDGTAERHTTVGTANEAAIKPYYFIDGITSDTVSGRVMAFWADSNATSGFSFQTAQDVYKGVDGKVEGTRYRVNLPSDVTEVVFAVAKTDCYGMPTYNSATHQFTFNSNAFTAITDNITVSAQTNTFTFTAKTADTLPKLTGTTGSFVPES